MAGNEDGDAHDLVLVWQRADGPGAVEFVITSSNAEELLSLLVDEGVSAVPQARRVRGAGTDVLTTVVATAGNAAAWAATGVAVRKFIDRHKGKRIQVDEDGLAEAENYSARDIERIVRALSAVERDDNDDSGGQK
ncbi:hypothetical protein [Actinomadura roseirufa]|uniref:hypothetical protein n=1 Tax=Actinomadura roseirufa TaxID=2094049 RepID=UPI0010414607|nr:hypothetical protein [Actinomadura roseirufa]